MTFNKANKIAHAKYLLNKEREMRIKDEAYIRELIDDKKFLLGVIESIKKRMMELENENNQLRTSKNEN